MCEPRPGLKLVVLGVSMGGLEALKFLLRHLPANYPLPLVAVQHLNAQAGNALAPLLNAVGGLHVKEADDGEIPQPGTLYLAPANYHLQVEPGGRLSLSTDPPVHFARPAVDVLFETAAAAHGSGLVGIVLTGAGSDGSLGLKRIQDQGGLTLVQSPADAQCDGMPRQALLALTPDYQVTLAELPSLLLRLAGGPPSAPRPPC